MAEKNREVLKQYFRTGAAPTQVQFADLIDSAVNLVDSGLTIDASRRVGLGSAHPRARLSVQGAFDRPLFGTIAIAAAAGPETTAIATGTGTRFSSQLAVGDRVEIGASILTVTDIQSDLQMTVQPAPEVAVPATQGFVRGELLAVEDAAGTVQLVMDGAGNVGIGTASPEARLQVAGTVAAVAFEGDGAAIVNLRADQIATGTIDAERIPQIPAENIAGLISPEHLQPIPASMLTGTQPFNIDLIPPIPAAKITGSITVDQLPQIPASRLTGTIDAERIPPIPAENIAGLISPEHLQPIPASMLTGTQPFNIDLIPPIPAAKITGSIAVDQLPQIPASKLTAEHPFSIDLIPPIPAANIAGLISPDHLQPIPASMLTGTQPFHIDLIPPIPAAKITGSIAVDQLPQIPASKLTAEHPFNIDLIPPIPAANVIGLVRMLDDLAARIRPLEAELGYPFAVTWDFENATDDGSVSTSAGQSPVAWATAVASQTGGGPAEKWGGVGTVLLTRQFGSDFQYPFIDLTAAKPVTLQSLSFRHFHNHNYRKPSYPSYQVGMQIDTGGGFADIGAAFTADQSTNGTVVHVTLGRSLPVGKVRIRWVPSDLHPSPSSPYENTGSEYFALKDVILTLRLGTRQS